MLKKLFCYAVGKYKKVLLTELIKNSVQKPKNIEI